ncbi:MAG: hypothetical protein IT183_05045 [Acidobacteria bacterium]|nr:hypothetical protein [Acidobacteriota bacterium]
MRPSAHIASWLIVCLSAMPASVSAQPAANTADAEPPASAHRPAHPRRVYAGMWTTHLKEDALVVDNNWAVGVTAGGYFVAAFLNSFGEPAFAGGLQRTLLSSAPNTVVVSAGYRLGAITGYDGRLMRIARKTPVLPLLQPFAMIDIHRVGIEVSCTFVVVSVATSFRF